MRKEEASWIHESLQSLILDSQPATIRLILNLGCGTRESREIHKPYIQSMTIDPLLKLGAQVVHSDLIQAPGIDLSGNIFDPDFIEVLKKLQPNFIYFCNILEHLPRHLRIRVPFILNEILQSDGYLVITAPYSYPYHPDPIDTMYRPSIDELSALFPTYSVLAASEMNCGSYLEELKRSSTFRIFRKVVRLFFPFIHLNRWLSHAHRFLWIARPYKISCVMLKKSTEEK